MGGLRATRRTRDDVAGYDLMTFVPNPHLTTALDDEEHLLVDVVIVARKSPLARRQHLLHQRDLHQRRCGNRHRNGFPDAVLDQRQESAIGGQPVAARGDKVLRCGDEVVDLVLAAVERRCGFRVGERTQEQPRIGQYTYVGFAVALEIGLAAIRGHQGRGAANVAAIVETEIRRHAGEDNDVGFLERNPPLVPAMQPVRGTEQSARHAGEIHGDSECAYGLGDGISLPGVDERLAANHEQRPFGTRELACGLPNDALCGWQRSHGHDLLGSAHVRSGEEPPRVVLQVRTHDPVREGIALRRRAVVPLADDRCVVQQVDRALDEDRPREISVVLNWFQELEELVPAN